MSALRDLIVSIDFDDIDVNNLTRVDTAMDAIEDQFRTMGGDLADIARDFDLMGGDASDALRDIQTDGDRAADVMDDLRDETTQAGNQGSDALDDLADAADDATDASDDLETQMNNTSNSTGGLGKSIKGLIGIVAAFVAVDKIKDLAISMVEAAASATATEAQFAQVFEGMEDAAAGALGRVSDETQVMSGRLKGSFLGIAAFAKTTGMDTAGALELTERATLAAADGAAFYDKSIEEVSESLQSFLKGNYANDAALGISATETTRNATANKLYGKSFKKLSEEQKQMTLLQMVEDGNKLSGALGQASREGDGFENVIGNLKQSWTDLMAKSGSKLLDPVVNVIQAMTGAVTNFDPTPILNFLEKSVEFGGIAVGVLMGVKDTVMALVKDTGGIADIWEAIGVPPGLARTIEMVSGVIGTILGGAVDVASDAFVDLQGLFQWGMDNIDTVSAVVLGLGTAFVALKVINIISTGFGLLKAAIASNIFVTTAQTIAQHGLNAAMKANPIGFIITAIGILVTAGVLLWQNWDTVRAKTGELWDKLGAFQGVANIVLGPLGFIIRAAVTMAEQWDSTRSVWDNVWNGIKITAETVVNEIIESINKLIGVINKVPGIKIPVIPKVDWSGVDTEPPAGMADLKKADGSHATGLFDVPYDGYTAELHAGESVLTANQSGALRAAGMLKNNGGKPAVSFGGGGGGPVGPGGGNGSFVPTVNVYISGSDSEGAMQQKIEAAVQAQLAMFWRQMNLKQA